MKRRKKKSVLDQPSPTLMLDEIQETWQRSHNMSLSEKTPLLDHLHEVHAKLDQRTAEDQADKIELSALTDPEYYDPRSKLRYILETVYELQNRLDSIEDVLYAALAQTPRDEEEWHHGHDQEPKRRGNT